MAQEIFERPTWGIPLGDPRVMPRYYGTIVTLGILVRAGVYLWVTHG